MSIMSNLPNQLFITNKAKNIQIRHLQMNM